MKTSVNPQQSQPSIRACHFRKLRRGAPAGEVVAIASYAVLRDGTMIYVQDGNEKILRASLTVQLGRQEV